MQYNSLYLLLWMHLFDYLLLCIVVVTLTVVENHSVSLIFLRLKKTSMSMSNARKMIWT